MGKEMTEKRRRTMSVELAIQREMAFRKKIKDLQLLPNDDSGNVIMAVQVQFPSRSASRPDVNSSSSLSGREQVASLSHPGCLPSPKSNQNPSSRPNICSGPGISERKQLASSSKSPSQQLQLSKGCSLNHKSHNIFCEVCQVPCSGSLNYKQHINGKKHKVRLQELKIRREDGDETCATANQKPWCKLCKILCSDYGLLKQHLAGQKHKKMQEKLERATTVGGVLVEKQNWCELCSIECSSKELLQLHFNGKKHQAELRKLKCTPKGSEETEDNWCELCGIGCSSKELLQLHFNGKKHKAELRKLECTRKGSEEADNQQKRCRFCNDIFC